MEVRRAGALRRYLEVVRSLAQRDFVGRYRGNLFGALSTVAVPLLFLSAYTFVFSAIIPIRIRPGASEADYAFFLFSGLVGWNLFAEAAGQAPRLYVVKAHFVRKASFPVSALPVAVSLTAFYHALVWLAVFLAVRYVAKGDLTVTALAAPLVLVPLAAFAAGVSLLMSAIGALVRDLGELVAPILTLGMFLSPVLYPAERIAGVAPWLVYANPLAPMIEALHATLLDGTLPDAASIVACLGWAAVALVVGVVAHRVVRPVLGDIV